MILTRALRKYISDTVHTSNMVKIAIELSRCTPTYVTERERLAMTMLETAIRDHVAALEEIDAYLIGE